MPENTTQQQQKPGDESRQAFVSQGDRPEVKLDADTPISQLRVRDLTAILGTMTAKRYEFKTLAQEYKKAEFKDFKDNKNEKRELEPVKFAFEPPIDFGSLVEPEPDPWRQVIEGVTGLANRVEQLANQVAELQKKVGR